MFLYSLAEAKFSQCDNIYLVKKMRVGAAQLVVHKWLIKSLQGGNGQTINNVYKIPN